MLPPPTTTANSSPTPHRTDDLLGDALDCGAVDGSCGAAVANASPDSLSTTRRGSPTGSSAQAPMTTCAEPHDAGRTEHARDRLLLVPHVGLVEWPGAAVHRGHLRADGVARHHGPGQRGAGKDTDPGDHRHRGGQPVGQAGHGVLLGHDERDRAQPRRPDARRRWRSRRPTPPPRAAAGR